MADVEIVINFWYYVQQFIMTFFFSRYFKIN